MKTPPRRSILLLLCIVLVSPTVSFAKHSTPQRIDYSAIITAYASMLKARADMLRAAAEAAHRKAQSDKLCAETRQLELENELRAAKLFYAKRRLNREHRERQRRQRSMPSRSRSLSRRYSSKITWPALMMESKFKKQRMALEKLVEQSLHGQRKVSDQQVRRWIYLVEKRARAEATPQTADQFLATLRTLKQVEWLILHGPTVDRHIASVR